MMFKNKKMFKFLYYLSLILVISVFLIFWWCVVSRTGSMLGGFEDFFGMLIAYFVDFSELPLFRLLLYINTFCVICVSISFALKKDIKNINILFPMFFIVFSLILSCISMLFADRVILPEHSYMYYFTYIYGGYLFLNIYTLLSIEWKKKKNDIDSSVSNVSLHIDM